MAKRFARDLKAEDEIRITAMGGEDFLTVRDIRPGLPGKVALLLSWGFHVPCDDFWTELPRSKKLTVRR